MHHDSKCEQKLLFIIITFTLSIIIPSSIYSETYGWFAGFYNYIPSSIVSLLFYILLYIYFMVRKKRVSIIFGFLIACLFGQLFIEYDNIQQFNDSHRFNYLFLST